MVSDFLITRPSLLTVLNKCSLYQTIFMENVKYVMINIKVALYLGESDQGPLLLTWFNFNPSMDK